MSVKKVYTIPCRKCGARWIEACFCERDDQLWAAYKEKERLAAAAAATAVTAATAATTATTATAVTELVTDTMSNAARALFEGCALPFSNPERSGYTYCKECASAECEHCICPVKTCKRNTCEHFFVRHNMNPALYRAWRNAPWPHRLLDGFCFCTTCNTTFACHNWDIDPGVGSCDGDCNTCLKCKPL